MKKHRVILGHLAPVFCVAYDVTGQRILTGADDDLAKVWCSQSGQLVATLRGHSAELTDISISWDNSMIATGSLDKMVRVWCGQSSAPLSVLSGHAGHITSVQISPTSSDYCRYVASTAKDGCLLFWKWDPFLLKFSDAPIKFMEKNRISDQTLCSAFSPGGNFYVTGGTDRIVRVYRINPDSPVVLAELKGHNDRIMTVQFSNAGQCLFATGACDGSAILWQYKSCHWSSIALSVIADDAKLAKPDKVNHVTMICWERTDTYLVTAHSPDCHVRVWRVSDGTLVSLLKGHTNEVFVVECHPLESRILMTAGHDGVVIIWDMMNGVKLNEFQLEYEDEGIPCIFDCKWSPDGLSCAAADSFGYLTLFGFGSSFPYEKHPDEQFFHTDYRPLMRDRNHYVIDEQAQVPPHLLPPPYLVDIDGHPHPLKYQQPIINLIRPARGTHEDKMADDMEDYDGYMKRHFNRIKGGFVNATRNRTERNNEVNVTDDGSDVEPQREDHHDDGDGNNEEEHQSEDPPHDNDGVIVPEQISSDEPKRGAAIEDVVNVESDDGEDSNNQMAGNNISNMLSSIVYSLGLDQNEARVAINRWHSRNILPPLDTALISSELSRLSDISTAEEEWFQYESEKTIEISPSSTPIQPSPQGRALRSGRTIDTEEHVRLFSSSREGDSDRDSDSDAVIPDEAWESTSTASSDISDWTNEAGYEISQSFKKSRRAQKRRESAISEITIDEERNEEAESSRRDLQEESGSDRPKSKGKKTTMKKLIKNGADYSIYWPPNWLKMRNPHVTPYYPQVGDIVVYFHQGHELYKEEVKKQKAYQWKNQQMPRQKHTLKPHEFCQVKNVHFVIGPPTLCSITLTLLSSTSSSASSDNIPSTSQPTTFTFKYHDMDNSLDFLILDSIYKASLHRHWEPGDKFKSLIDGSYWAGTVLTKQSYSEEYPNSFWQCYHVKWDDGATDQLSPWDMEPLDDGQTSLSLPLMVEDPVIAWGGKNEHKRILNGFRKIMEVMEEAEMFINPVDLEEEVVYCTVVPFPTDLSTITERLANGFYRRKLALIWEVILLSRNASSYNEERSHIVQNSKILTQTLVKFIQSPTCTDPLKCYQPEVNDNGTPLEVTAPDYVPTIDTDDMDVFFDDIPNSTSRKRRIKNMSSDEEKDDNTVTAANTEAWRTLAKSIIDEIYSHEDSYPFIDAVDTDMYPDYLNVISHPMDLSTVNSRLIDGYYPTPAGFVNDVNLIFNNAKSYNREKSQIYKMASELQNLFNTKVMNVLHFPASDKHTHNYRTRLALERIAVSLDSLNEETSPLENDEDNINNDKLINGHGGSDRSSVGSDASYDNEEEEEGEELMEEVMEEVMEEEEEVMDQVTMTRERMTRSKARTIAIQNEVRPIAKRRRKRRTMAADSNDLKRRRMMTRSTRSSISRQQRWSPSNEGEDEACTSSDDNNEPLIRVTRAGRISCPRLRN
jgi:bromodomain and WD repeat domain-containing protein 1/3